MVRSAIGRDDRGVGTVLGAMMGSILLGAGIVVSALVSIAVAHQRASVAADLATLAAASQGCPAAERVALAQGALGVACFVDGVDVIVTVAIPAPVMLERVASWSGREAPAIAGTARAGPASG